MRFVYLRSSYLIINFRSKFLGLNEKKMRFLKNRILFLKYRHFYL